MKNDRKISFSVGASRRATQWNSQTMLVSALWEKLKTPARSAECLAEYMSYNKAKQDELKDIGGFVGGTLNGPRRKANNVVGRDLVTLDLDNIPPGGTDNVVMRVDGLGCGYCIYSTRKHQPAAPRLRIIIPLDRTVTADEYEPIARKMGEWIGLEFADPTTFEVSRLMYWPSCSSDSQYVYYVGDKPFVSADGVLGAYEDWHDMTQWPALPGMQTFTKLAVKQGDPESKNGVVGAFCRIYDVHRAMDELIPGIYEPVDNMPDRYTYIEGSTTGGAVLYDSGKFLYSHHATDPCSGKLVNAFDLVRLHRFSDLDDDAQMGTPINRLPSYTKMCELALGLPDVKAQKAYDDFAGIDCNDDTKPDWIVNIATTQNGEYRKTLGNIKLIIQNHPELNGCVKKDLFSGKILAADGLPWRHSFNTEPWSDADLTELRQFLEKWFKPSKQDVKDAVVSVAESQSFHPVRDYLHSLKWDGTPRLDNLFIDYLGAEDSEYIKAVTRKSLVACVKRVMTPGCKFDYMPVFIGAQGRNKSSILRILGGNWTSDSMVSFEGKEAMEAVRGVWLIEIPELSAFRRSDMNSIKAFITKQSDYFRAAYAEYPKDNPRQCVFFGTTNEFECLHDTTGNRRFWPIKIDVQTRSKSVFEHLPLERDQIWAEAVVRWQLGEPLYLTGAIEEAAKEKQEEHRDASSREGIVRDFIDKEVPEDWSKWSLDKRRMYWAATAQGDIRTVKRDRVCALEIWCEAFGGSIKECKNADAREINAIISAMPDWKKNNNPIYFGPYGKQRGFYTE